MSNRQVDELYVILKLLDIAKKKKKLKSLRIFPGY